ncbi:MAG: helicase-related protein, partial [Candidatus Hodarchaeales archaeon]
LETLIVKIKRINPQIQLLGLSATIPNADEFASWMGATLVSSDWRPVPLKKRVFADHVFYNSDDSLENFNGKQYSDQVLSLADETLTEERGQVLCFANTRRSASALAKRLTAVTERKLQPQEIQNLAILAKRITKGGRVDPASKQLSLMVKKGSAYHHAGLDKEQRSLIEEGYKKNLIKALSATPTLAAGVNLPARRVIITASWRYSMRSFGRENLKVAEIHQMMGRAGRPKYDKEGDAVLIAKDEETAIRLLMKYIQGEPEPVTSKLAVGPTLRSIILGLITGKLVKNFEEIMEFISETLFGYQIGAGFLEENVSSILDFLKESGMLDVDEVKYLPTKYGIRVSQLYLDPLSADLLRKGIERAIDQKKAVTDYAWLQLIASTPDLSVFNLKLGRKEYTSVQTFLEECKDDLLVDIPDIWSNKFEYLLQQLKTAKLLEAWIDERDLVEIITNFSTTAGDINRLVEIAKWICYSASSIARIIVQEKQAGNHTVKHLYEVEMRLTHGIEKQLIPLCRIRGIGRVRARTLYNAGYKNPGDLKTVPIDDLLSLKGFGSDMVRNIMREIGRKLEDDLPEDAVETENQPYVLSDYFTKR